jgi:hypothetical protein
MTSGKNEEYLECRDPRHDAAEVAQVGPAESCSLSSVTVLLELECSCHSN